MRVLRRKTCKINGIVTPSSVALLVKRHTRPMVQRNKRDTIFVNYNGTRRTLAKVCEERGIALSLFIAAWAMVGHWTMRCPVRLLRDLGGELTHIINARDLHRGLSASGAISRTGLRIASSAVSFGKTLISLNNLTPQIRGVKLDTVAADTPSSTTCRSTWRSTSR
jgi:hypothetical protein